MPLPGPIIQGVTSGGVTVPFRVNATGQLETSSAANPVGTTGPSKIEDAVHVSGDMGTFVLGVRAPATPIAPASAAGDYSLVLVDSEGKLITAGTGDSAQTVQANVILTAVTDAALLAAAGATLRNYVTDITAENNSDAAVRVIVRDGTTNLWSATLPARTTVSRSFNTPLRGTVNTAINGQLSVAGSVPVSIGGYKGI